MVVNGVSSIKGNEYNSVCHYQLLPPKSNIYVQGCSLPEWSTIQDTPL